MGTPNGARVEGLNKTIRALTKLGVEASELKTAMGRITDLAVKDAKALAPVGKTSKLVNSIRGNKAKATAIVRAGTKAVDYAPFNEFGTEKITAKEFVTRAVTGNRDRAVVEIESELRQIIRRLDLQ